MLHDFSPSLDLSALAKGDVVVYNCVSYTVNLISSPTPQRDTFKVVLKATTPDGVRYKGVGIDADGIKAVEAAIVEAEAAKVLREAETAALADKKEARKGLVNTTASRITSLKNVLKEVNDALAAGEFPEAGVSSVKPDELFFIGDALAVFGSKLKDGDTCQLVGLDADGQAWKVSRLITFDGSKSAKVYVRGVIAAAESAAKKGIVQLLSR